MTPACWASSPVDEALRAHELMDLACVAPTAKRPLVVEPGNSAGASADEHGAVYLPYFDMDVIFDDGRARVAAGARRDPPAAPQRVLRRR